MFPRIYLNQTLSELTKHKVKASFLFKEMWGMCVLSCFVNARNYFATGVDALSSLGESFSSAIRGRTMGPDALVECASVVLDVTGGAL